MQKWSITEQAQFVSKHCGAFLFNFEPSAPVNLAH